MTGSTQSRHAGIRRSRNTPVTLTVSGSGITYSSSTGVPASGTDADDIFGGFVDFSTAHPHSLALSGNDHFTYTFSGLNPSSQYEFAGTAVRRQWEAEWKTTLSFEIEIRYVAWSNWASSSSIRACIFCQGIGNYVFRVARGNVLGAIHVPGFDSK